MKAVGNTHLLHGPYPYKLQHSCWDSISDPFVILHAKQDFFHTFIADNVHAHLMH
jgi:hypothetical protein